MRAPLTVRGSGSQLLALGRLKPGAMNRTEAAYAARLDLRKRAGDVAWYRFEGIKLRLADATFLTVDFAVMEAGGLLSMVDVKGSPAIITDDARVKMKVAADQYPFVFKLAYPDKGSATGWKEETL